MKRGEQYRLFEMYSQTAKWKPPTFIGRRKNYLLYLVVIILVLGLVLTCLNVYELHRMKLDHEVHHREFEKLPEIEGKNVDQTYAMKSRPIVWIQGNNESKDKYRGRSSYLKHVFNVFEKLGFTIGDKLTDWYVLWSHDYPFITFERQMKNLRPFQRVNHFPGSGYITNKVTLAQENFDFIPKAFELPARKSDFLKYSDQHKEMKWVQKSNRHRGIEVKSRDELDYSKKGTFIQQFVSNPFLIDGYKFDIGVYTIITSLDPVRVYFIDGDALFRFCPEQYYPFDPSKQDKYVVGDDYLPMWQLPSLEDLYLVNGLTFKESFNEYLRKTGKNPQLVWNKIKSAIKQVVLSKESDLLKVLVKYPSRRNFFELMRLDFVLDEDLNVFLMEANMSPNLSSDHFPPNARLYEHVIFNLLNLVGITHFVSSNHSTGLDYEDSTLVSSADIRVFPELCSAKVCKNSCLQLECKLCKKCLDRDLEKDLKIAYLEHTRRGSSRRIFPPVFTQSEALEFSSTSSLPDSLTMKNKLIYLWFIGKCRLDSTWCQ